ncbi:MAG: hypothetical protein QXG00_08645 [Candidatus Woesearchaeota archaeon]
MTYLVAVLGAGKGTWAHLLKMIRKGVFEKCFLITNEFGRDKFNEPNCELIVVDFNKPSSLLACDIKKKLEGKIFDTEVGFNMISGTGSEHMATLAALLKLGLGIRLIDMENDELQEL